MPSAVKVQGRAGLDESSSSTRLAAGVADGREVGLRRGANEMLQGGGGHERAIRPWWADCQRVRSPPHVERWHDASLSAPLQGRSRGGPTAQTCCGMERYVPAARFLLCDSASTVALGRSLVCASFPIAVVCLFEFGFLRSVTEQHSLTHPHDPTMVIRVPTPAPP